MLFRPLGWLGAALLATVLALKGIRIGYGVVRFFHGLKRRLEEIMAKIDEVMQALSDLQGSVTSIGTDVSAGLTALEDEIKRVEALIAGGGATPEQLQQVLEGLTAAKTSVDSADATAKQVKTEADAERP
jgi:multidrug resistance efflux pump